MNDSSLSISTISLRFAGRHELLLRDWQRFYQQQLPNPAEYNCHLPEFWAVAMLDELAHNEPDTAWLLILELIRQPLGDDAFCCLAAGPLKNLLEYHGPAVIERVEDEARSNPAFQSCFGGRVVKQHTRRLGAGRKGSCCWIVVKVMSRQSLSARAARACAGRNFLLTISKVRV
jgi:hypothetical protein